MTASDSPRDIACIELVELLTEYLEGTLPDDEVAAIEAHLAICAPCRIYLAQMRATIAALGSVPVDTLSASAQDSLLAAFRDLRR
ncbi:anti-sigma factor family protein [Pseudonocardia sp. CA-107938]|uniref:anti-sigma factor family protein n=1 Tax=Pseudonocardia sp. CA-107938 TaxID=3240021 RepID=UPI003D93767A